MLADKYLAGIEQLEFALIKRVSSLKAFETHAARSSSRRKQYLMMYIIGILTSLSSALQAILEVLKAIILSSHGQYSRRMHTPATSTSATPVKLRSSDVSIGKIGVEISFSSGSAQNVRHDLCKGIEVFITTESSQMISSDNTQFLVIPNSADLPPVTIWIKPGAKSAKLIYQTVHRNRIRITRRFGLDEVPIKLGENLNVSTDKVIISNEVSVTFVQVLVRAQSAP